MNDSTPKSETLTVPEPVYYLLHLRLLAVVAGIAFLLAPEVALGGIGIEPVPNQTIPSGKTLVVPIPASDPYGPPRSYTVTVGNPTTSGSATTTAGIVATVRTGDPHLILGVTYTDSNSVMQTGTMEFQLLREFAPVTTQIIAGLAEGGFYNPRVSVSGTSYVPFHRVVPGFVIQGGDPTGTGTGGPGFTFQNEFNSALIFSGSAGQLGMANSGYGVAVSGTTIITGTTTVNGVAVDESSNGTNGSQFFVTLANDRAFDLDFKYNLFGQLLRGFDTLFGIVGTPLETNTFIGEYSEPINPVDITGATVTQNDTDAVLLLSATGLCSATVTVTASSGTESATQTFTAYAQADTYDDPPYPRLVPDITARNGTAKIPLMAGDLQYDLVRYGCERVLLVTDAFATTGTSPLVSIPLVSNTDNVVAATFDDWNNQDIIYFGEGNNSAQPNIRVFHIGAGDKPIRGSLAPIPAGSNGTLFVGGNSPVATCTTANEKDHASSFTASVNWGDGTLLSGTPGVTIVQRGVGAARKFKVMASHTYDMPGEYPVIVEVSDPGGASLILNGTANVGADAIGITPRDIYKAGGVLKNRVVATFTDAGSGGTVSDYAANIDWGDGIVTPGAIKAAEHHIFQVLGTHTYATPSQFTISTTVTRSGTDTGSCWATAYISGINAPRIFPPFPQAHLSQMWSSIVSDSNVISNSDATGDGGNPQAPLIKGADGYLYGTTIAGGGSGNGTIYRISTTGSETVLYSFTGGVDGGTPIGGLAQLRGDLYGTTSVGGTTSSTTGTSGGTVFEYSLTSGSLATLYTFSGGSDGGQPMGTLIQATDGNLYGTTETDGSNDYGTVFQCSLTGSLATIHTFDFSNDGGNPMAGVIQGSDGNLYGTTEEGGAGDGGTVYELATTGSFSVLHAFMGSDGYNSFAGVIQATDGNLYGTTISGGDYAAGVVFQCSTTGSYSTIYNFSANIGVGGLPRAGVIQGSDGNLYGTTSISAGGGTGTVFQLSTAGSFNNLYSFSGYDGSIPEASLFQDPATGIFYGTTYSGGPNGTGAVFSVTASDSNSFQLVHSFSGGTGNTFQIGLSCSVMIVNSGNVTSGTGSFSVYVDPNGELDGQQTAFESQGQTSFAIPALQPGQSYVLHFDSDTLGLDNRLKLPVGFNPTGQEVIGVVTYSDPVGDYDGSQKIVSPFSF